MPEPRRSGLEERQELTGVEMTLPLVGIVVDIEFKVLFGMGQEVFWGSSAHVDPVYEVDET